MNTYLLGWILGMTCLQVGFTLLVILSLGDVVRAIKGES